MNWKKLLTKNILDRGYEYYSEDAVESMNFSDELITASVCGSEDYDVEISLSDGKIEEMYCSCPYAEGGRNCKHMAAVLYEWFENREEIKSAYTVRGRADRNSAVKKLVAEADIKDIRSFLSDVLTDDESLFLRFCNMVGRKNHEFDIKKYYRQINLIIRRHSAGDGFVNYSEADDLAAELEESIDIRIYAR